MSRLRQKLGITFDQAYNIKYLVVLLCSQVIFTKQNDEKNCMDDCIGFISICFLDKIITGNNENNGSYFVETLYNSRCTAYNGTALDNRGHTISCPQLFIEN